MEKNAMRQKCFKTTLATLVLCGVGVANAQPGGGGGSLPPPVFDPALTFNVNVVYPFGLAATDFLDANGNPGQDGYPEIAVAGTGVHLFEPDQGTDCGDHPLPHFIKIYHNLGADPNFAWDGPNADTALSEVQTLNIDDADPEMWAMELAFADVTGTNGPDLVLVGQDPDVPSGFLVVFKNNGDGTFNPTPQVWHTTVPLEGVVVKDFDLDGDIDVIASSSNLHDDWLCSTSEQDAVVVFENVTNENSGILSFASPVSIDLGIPGNFAPGDIVTDDFNALSPGQPLLDLATPNPHDGSITALTNIGNLNFIPDTQTASGNTNGNCTQDWFYVSAASSRFGADINWDFAAVHTQELLDPRVFIDVFQGDGRGAFTTSCSNPAGYTLETPQNGNSIVQAQGIASGSIDNGPYPDLVAGVWVLDIFTRSISSGVGVLLGKADGTFQAESPERAYLFDNGGLSAGTVPTTVMVVDLNADGFDDIVVANHGYDGFLQIDTISVHINALSVSISGP